MRRAVPGARRSPARRRDGSVLDVGRRTRTISPALRRALEVRDRGCRFPDHSPTASGARGLRFTAHHVTHWGDGGETSLGNAVLVCRHHHALVHKNRLRGVEPDGRTAGARWKREGDIPRGVYLRALEATG